MRDNRGEPAEVWLRNGRPARFVWRGRMYTVIFVLSSAEADALPGGRECWRVEATPERAVPSTIFELCYDPATDHWSLMRG